MLARLLDRRGALARGLLLGCLPGLSTCRPSGAFLQIDVDGIPTAASSLTTYALLNDRLANQAPVFPVTGQGRLVLGLVLDHAASGPLSVSVGAQDADGCLRAVGDVSTAVREQDTLLKLGLTLAPLAAPLCPATEPVILGAEPGQISTAGKSRRGERGLDIVGWNFRPGTTVRIGGQPQCATLKSVRRLHLEAPLLVQPPGPAQVVVQVPDRAVVRSDSGLVVSMAPVESMWRPPLRYAPSAELLDLVEAPLRLGEPTQVIALDKLGQGWLYRPARDPLSDAVQLTSELAGPLFSLPGFQISQSAALAAADLNGDGLVDVAVVSAVGSFLLWRAANGTFSGRTEFPTLSGQDTALADLDGDGKAEWLVAGDALRVFRNPGDGRFASTESQRVDLATAALTVADLDGDGARDVAAVAAPPLGQVRVLYNRGGALGSASDYLVRACSAGGPRPGLVAAYLDEDEQLDLAINGSAALLLNRGGTFEYRYIAGVTPCFGGAGVTAADLNADGATDLAWLNTSGVTALFNMGAARFGTGPETQAQLSFPLGSGNTLAAEYRRILTVDASGDGAADLVVGGSLLSGAAPARVRCGEGAAP